MKKNLQNIINYGKVIGIYFIYLLIILLALSSFTLCLRSLTSIYYSDDHIDDRYGALDTNTKQVIDEEIKKLMKNKRINVYFSYLYKDLNETYKDRLYGGEKYIFLYYNEEDNSFKVSSDIKLVEKMNLNYIIENGDIKTTFENAVNLIDKKIDKQSKKMFYKSEKIAVLVSLFSFFATVIFIIVFFAIICSDKISRILMDSKEEIRENAIKKIDKKILQEETEKATDNRDDTDTTNNIDDNDETNKTE